MAGFFSGCTDDQLRQAEIFADLDDEALDSLRNHSLFIGAHPGMKVVEAGDTGFELYVVLAGEADVQKDGEKVARLGPGDTFGEMAILGGRVRNADVVAASVMSIMSMTASALRKVTARYPQIEERLRQIADQRTSTG